MREVIKKSVKSIGLDPGRIKGWLIGLTGSNVARNVCHTKYDKRALIAYIITPFKDENFNSNHQNAWQVMELARILSSYGYNVDAIPYVDPYVHLKGKYDLVIAQFPKDCDCYTRHLKPDAIKIAYITTSSPEFNNSAELGRLSDLKERTGKQLKAYRQLPPMTDDIYSYDAALVMSNKKNADTYSFLPKTYFINNTSKDVDMEEDYSDKDPKCFMYLGSVGQVHKGLDLLLEIFSEKDFPCELYVCGAYEHERDFYDVYRDILFNTPNIHPMDVVDTSGEIYRDVARKCAFMIGPSCAEGMSGAVLTSMASGVIPIVSAESGFDGDEVILLDDCNKECIRETVIQYSHRDTRWITDNSNKCKDIIRNNYMMDNYRDSVNKALAEIVEHHVDAGKHVGKR